MKRNAITSAIVAGTIFFSSLTNAAGIPVFDAVGNLERIEQWTAKLQQWQQTVTHYQSQLQAYKSQLATASGVRDIQAFFGQAKNLTNDLKNLRKNGISMNDLLTNPNGQYTGALNSLYNKYSMFDSCKTTQSESYADTCKKIVINKAVAIEETTATQDKISDTLNDISSLASRIELSPDTKESQDLANAINTKSVQLTALTTQWDMSVKQSELRDQMLAQQRQKDFAEQQKNAPVPDFNNL